MQPTSQTTHAAGAGVSTLITNPARFGETAAPAGVAS